MKVTITVGQDTAAYCTKTIEAPFDIADDQDKLREFLVSEGNKIVDDDESDFAPEFDFSNPRIVTAKAGDKLQLEDIPLGVRYHDAGLLLGSAINEQRLSCFLEAASEVGKTEMSSLQFLVAVAEEAEERLAKLSKTA